MPLLHCVSDRQCELELIGKGQQSLPESCPVCTHSPLSADDCKPNKSLRLTVKAFLKAEERKREKERGSNATAKAAASDTPAKGDTPVVASMETPAEAAEKPAVTPSVNVDTPAQTAAESVARETESAQAPQVAGSHAAEEQATEVSSPNSSLTSC